MEYPEKYPQVRFDENIEQSLRTENEACKATAQELHEHRQRGCSRELGIHLLIDREL